MSAVKKTRDTIVLFVLLLFSFIRTGLGRNKPLPLPVPHADVPGITHGLLFRHASGSAYLETAKKFPFLRFIKDNVPGFETSGQMFENRNLARLGPVGRILLFGGPGASLQRQYAIELGGAFPYVRLSSAKMGRVGAALEFSPLRTSALADMRAYSVAISPSSSILEHGALPDLTDIGSSDSTCTSCTDCGGCGGCDCECGGSCCSVECECCTSCSCSSCSGFCC